jgi:hypothetical protein
MQRIARRGAAERALTKDGSGSRVRVRGSPTGDGLHPESFAVLFETQFGALAASLRGNHPAILITRGLIFEARDFAIKKSEVEVGPMRIAH